LVVGSVMATADAWRVYHQGHPTAEVIAINVPELLDMPDPDEKPLPLSRFAGAYQATPPASRPSGVWRVLRGLVVVLGGGILSYILLVLGTFLFLFLVAKFSGPLLKMQ